MYIEDTEGTERIEGTEDMQCIEYIEGTECIERITGILYYFLHLVSFLDVSFAIC